MSKQESKKRNRQRTPNNSTTAAFRGSRPQGVVPGQRYSVLSKFIRPFITARYNLATFVLLESI